jgi:hypothetical protein
MTMVHAQDYAYLTIVEQNGNKTSLTAIGLSMQFSNGNLTVSNAYTNESKTIALNNLLSMNFSNSNETTSIRHIQTDETVSIDDAEAIYTLQGQALPIERQLPKGIYIIRKGNETRKMQVR